MLPSVIRYGRYDEWHSYLIISHWLSALGMSYIPTLCLNTIISHRVNYSVWQCGHHYWHLLKKVSVRCFTWACVFAKIKYILHLNWIVLISTFLRYDGASDLSSAECYNPMSNKWAQVTPMGTKRSCLGESSSMKIGGLELIPEKKFSQLALPK